MIKKVTFILIGLFCFTVITSCSDNDNEAVTERVKISLREVGNQLLLQQKDSTSLILPVTVVGPSKYRLAFQNDLMFEPEALVGIIQHNFEKSALPNRYRVEVIQCDDGEVAYSYQMSDDDEQTIIPCIGRTLPKACYYIEVGFIGGSSKGWNRNVVLLFFGILTLGFVLFGMYKNNIRAKIQKKEHYVTLGSYKFYKSQNKLIKEAVEITLSKKECELLDIFVARPNEIITREELTKKVWEDNGVIVGRSLDTFISKLRKKLKDDNSIKITNVHGVGYKLELN